MRHHVRATFLSILALFLVQPSRGEITAVSSEAKALMADVQTAYDKLKSLRVAGTSTTTTERPGKPKPVVMASEFTGSYAAPGVFKFESGPTTLGEKKFVMDKGSASGCTGPVVYAYVRDSKRYRARDVTPGQKLEPKQADIFIGGLTPSNNPSLYFAAFTAGVQRFAEASAIEKIDLSKAADMELDGKKFAALVRRSDTLHETSTLLIDPQTHLVRRSTSVTEIPTGGKITVVVDYTTTTPDGEVKESEFAWTAPAGWNKQ